MVVGVAVNSVAVNSLEGWVVEAEVTVAATAPPKRLMFAAGLSDGWCGCANKCELSCTIISSVLDSRVGL